MTSSTAVPTPTRRTDRLHSLDGLRGAAALVVLVHHCLLLSPAYAGAYFPSRALADPGALAWVLSFTPLHIVWAGTEAVYLFFVLSGIVLVLPVLARPDFAWLAYYPRRILRLYGPVVAAVGLGLLSYALVDRYNDDRLGPWVNGRPNDYPGSAVLADVTLLTGASGRISPLWSLQWEVLFSLLLPLYVVFVRVGRRFDLAKVALVAALLVAGSVADVEALFFLPMFAVGALTASRWRSLKALVTRWSAGRRWFWPAVALVGVLLTCARWQLVGLGMSPSLAADFAFLSVPGVWLLVLTAWFSSGARSVLEAPLLQWAGRISFSLYLVHEPIVLAFRLLTAPAEPWVAVVVAVPVALVVAVAFERFVEARFHRLARSLGRRLQPRPAPARAS